MIKKEKKMAFFIVAIAMFSCSNYDEVQESNGNLSDLEPTEHKKVAIVSMEHAANVAQFFFNKQGEDGSMRSRSGMLNPEDFYASIETVKEKNVPQAYIVNHPEGGFVIVSASKNYYPILAYSDEGSFTLSADMGGVLVWLEETKSSIKVSEYLDEKSKAAMRSLWSSFETTDLTDISTKSSNNFEDMMWDRVGTLLVQHGPSGWYRYYPLTNYNVLDYFQNNMQAWQGLYNRAVSVGSPPEYTIVAIKNEFHYQQVGPLMSTRWHEFIPFNHLCPGQSPAGSAAIAMAQVMKFHQHPTSYNWANMPNTDILTNPAIHSTPALIREIGSFTGTTYGFVNSTTDINYVASTFLINKFQYSTAVIVDHPTNTNTIAMELISKKSPIIMSGQQHNSGAAIQYYWVCDGVRMPVNTNVEYFVEYMIHQGHGNYGYTNLGFSSVNSPGQLSLSYPTYFHMNWGSGSVAPAWFVNNDINVPGNPNVGTGVGFNYQFKRKNIHVTK